MSADPYTRYRETAEYADTCFAIMVTLHGETIDEAAELVTHAADGNRLVWAIRKNQFDRTMRSFEAAMENYHRAEAQRVEAFDVWIHAGATV